MDNSFAENIDSTTEICNSFGCLNKAKVKIVLPVGYKTVSIVVCESCRIKFE